MLYLAEVQKQKGGLLGGSSKTELKLLACQRSDQNWSTVSEEVMTADEASKSNDGALVLVELNPNRQVQRIQEAGRPLVNILQNFSRQLEKFKVKEEEIDQWKQSLTFQAQELNRREMDMEARLEQLQHTEDEFQRLEAQKQEVETSREEISRLRAEIDRNRSELEGAWEHLRGEQYRLQEYTAQSQQGTVLDQEQSQVLSDLLNCLSSSVAPTENVREHLNFAFEMLEKQQALLNPHWQQLNQQKSSVQQQQVDVERLSQILVERQNEYQQCQNFQEQQAVELVVKIATLKSKQEYVRMLKEHLRYQEKLYQQIHSLAAMSGNGIDSQQVDVQALENMSLEELQITVQDLQEKLENVSSFVHEQEQELTHKQGVIEELQQKLNEASESARSTLEAELIDEKDLYQMINESLVGQRRSLLEWQEFLRQHQVVLLRRQGNTLSNEEDEQNSNLRPILAQIETQRQQQSQELQNLEREIEQIRSWIEQVQGVIDHQTQQQEIKLQELQIMEQDLLSLRTATAESWGRINLYQETLQPLQDGIDGLKHKLQAIAEALAQVQETGDYQLQAIARMRQILLSLISQPELV
ncbi:MAG: pilus motility taxis protein HmpF [Stigonema ocellatum SAG 48.90 = DSM 106950]|nr:pilus motility taxis protein HmpF [Stigonema ocellatum SAG 48.90 = DSM 106950]